ncbi:MAG: hypothetical protein WCL18_07115 [bacterium]
MKGGGEAGGIYGVILSLNPPPLPWSPSFTLRLHEGQAKEDKKTKNSPTAKYLLPSTTY